MTKPARYINRSVLHAGAGAVNTKMLVAILVYASFICVVPATAATCQSLPSVSLPNAKVTLAQIVASGGFTPPAQANGGVGHANLFEDLPEFCRVAIAAKPSDDSDIRIEVWLPISGWNGNFRAAGNGNWGGAINFDGMAAILRTGFATASTDTGHEAAPTSVEFALGHPEKLKDFGYRAFHEMTADAKAIIAAFYGGAPMASYVAECGGGSREALSEIQRYPADYDAAGVYGFDGYKTLMHFGQLWVYRATHLDEASFLPPEALQLIHQAMLDKCDAATDGVKDGLVEDPPRCKFDPQVLLCGSAVGPNCLTAAQVKAAKMIYAPVTNPRTNEQVFSSLYPGSELAWDGLGGQRPFPNAVEFLRWVVFADPQWQYKDRPPDFDRDLALARQPEKAVINADDSNLKQFVGRGGKLLMIEGWADATIAPGGAVRYYDEVLTHSGNVKAARNSVRLFMVPGMGHCPGTNGRENFDTDTFGILKQWRETGKAPDHLIATRYQNGKEAGKRLVCAYPQVAVYKGSGAVEDPQNFTCRLPK